MSSPIQVFVDDSDPSIVYAGGPWVAQTGIPTAPQGLTSPGRTPWYGTLHKAVGDGNLSYTFHGTSISAYFLGNEAVIQTCAIDGKEQRVQTLFGQIICSNNVTLSDGQHKLTISTSSIDPIKGPITASFDGLYFTPSAGTLTQVKASGTSVDTMNMTATQSGPPTLSAPGDTFEFMFNGSSISLYSTFQPGDVSQAPAELSYTVDDGPRINFTITNPALFIDGPAMSQLIVQTPRYSSNRTHRFLFSYMGPAKNGQPIGIDEIIVQDSPSTLNLTLDAVPPLSSATQSSASSLPTSSHAANSQPRTSSSHSISHGAIIAIAVTLSVVVTLIACHTVIFFHRRRHPIKKSASTGASSTGVSPFIPSSFIRTVIPPSSKLDIAERGSDNWTHEKRDRHAGPPRLTLASTSTPTSQLVPLPPDNLGGGSRASHAIYRIHEDGCSVTDTTFGDASTRAVIDLPPVYSTLRQVQDRPRHSSAVDHAHA
ncbi:hypothetical protein D9613_010746 [Agrocybe pediades]|uniref:Transmembrane protein n=1 Tax=Agrocybe pediades TaxID=84607 RepID=A0A8H4QLH8_9AGAR|nr:hypothetical protein D9613_010746 [Agrocybe pediades]